VRIAYLCADRGVPVYGTKGASIHVRELCRALRAEGHEVLIVTARADGTPPEGFDVPVHEIPIAHGAASPAVREMRSVRYAADLPRRALPLLRRFGPEVIYERHSLFGTGGAALARALGVPLMLEVNAPLSDEHAAHRGLAMRGTARGLEGAALRAADRIVAVSPWLERWALSRGVEPGRVTVLPNGVDPERFAVADGKRKAVRARLGLDGRPVVGFLGTVKPWHDLPALIRATARLDGAGPAPRLLVVGDGPERERLEGLARAEGVEATFTGAVAHEDVPAHLAALDVAVVPYAGDEGFYFSPLKLTECLAAARPVVAADVGAIAHCVRPGETGALYRPGDVDGLAAAIRVLLADPAGAAALGRAGREHVRRHHTWAGNARTVADLARDARVAEGVAAWR
jgi:glycosyltransferase involved in cell wall biosynthesis